MRHLPERFVQPLTRILDEYEEWLRNSNKTRSQKDLAKYFLDNIKESLQKKHYDKQINNKGFAITKSSLGHK